MTKRLKLALILFSLSAFFFVHFYAPRFLTEINNPLVQLVRYKDSKPDSKESLNYVKHFKFTSFDGTILSAYINSTEIDSSKGTIILLHGIRSNKHHFDQLSNTLAELGYNAVALDLRAHGKSSGTHCTFGVKERKDVSELITFLLQQKKPNSNIGIWGQSLGGAVALQALGTDKRIKFGIVESTFSDFKTTANDYFNYHLGFNNELLTNYLVYRAGKIADFKPDQAKPIFFCSKIDQPIVLVHGTEDRRIPIKYAKENFKELKSSRKKFLRIEGADHLTVWKTGGTKYFNEVFTFIEKNTK